MSRQPPTNWVDMRRDAETGVESLRAHFHGHAYDAHSHDEVLVGVTQQGVQQFRCHRAMHTSTPGRAILIEPGAIHDGHAPADEGFTYAMLYLPQAWTVEALQRRGVKAASPWAAMFRSTLNDDPLVAGAISRAFVAMHGGEGRLARDQGLDHLMDTLCGQLRDEHAPPGRPCGSSTERARDFLHAHMDADISLDDLATHSGVDRFRLTRQFSAVFGQSPHAYLVNLRLRAARQRLASGERPADVASRVGFADQSHLGRWFHRAYGMTPGAYRRQCTNVLEAASDNA